MLYKNVTCLEKESKELWKASLMKAKEVAQTAVMKLKARERIIATHLDWLMAVTSRGWPKGLREISATHEVT